MDRHDIGPFGPETIAGFVAGFPTETRFVLAFSGGADSLALLHAFAQARECNGGLRLCAVHVDHHLHPESTRWAHQCMEVCRRLSVELTVLDADLKANDAGHGDEGTARHRSLRGVRAHPLSARLSCALPTPKTTTWRPFC